MDDFSKNKNENHLLYCVCQFPEDVVPPLPKVYNNSSKGGFKDCDTTKYRVRSKNYLTTKFKEFSGPAKFELLGVDFFKNYNHNKLTHYGSHPQGLVQVAIRENKETRLE
jgi:hypothetical protein